MGVLSDTVKLESSKSGIVNYFKDNSLLFYNQFQSPDNNAVSVINTTKIEMGKFYFFYYYDQSKWLQYSPVFVVDYKKFDNRIILYAINFNFIPIQVRTAFFDKFIKNISDEDQFNALTFTNTYTQLLRIGYEYSLMEFDARFVNRVYKISFDYLPKFLNFSHPQVKYDPNKLYDIWVKKLKTKEQRHQEMIQSVVSDFYDFKSDVNEKFDVLSKHIKRIENNNKKFS